MAELGILTDEFAKAAAEAGRRARQEALESGYAVQAATKDDAEPYAQESV